MIELDHLVDYQMANNLRKDGMIEYVGIMLLQKYWYRMVEYQ